MSLATLHNLNPTPKPIATTPKPKCPSSGSPKKQCLLIRVHAVAINPADYKLPLTPVVGMLMNRKPATPCLDYAGVVVEVPKGTKTDLNN